jgi:hypothetical protein
MSVDQNEATANPQSRRAFLTRLAVLAVGVAATMTLGVAETEATQNTGIEDKPNDIAVDQETAEGKVKLAETVDPHDPLQAHAQVYYRHRRRVARRVYRRTYRRTRRVARRVYRHRRRVYRRVRRRIVY